MRLLEEGEREQTLKELTRQRREIERKLGSMPVSMATERAKN
jgi:hypothetical protein